MATTLDDSEPADRERSGCALKLSSSLGSAPHNGKIQPVHVIALGFYGRHILYYPRNTSSLPSGNARLRTQASIRFQGVEHNVILKKACPA
jgi:hypothetical protein